MFGLYLVSHQASDVTCSNGKKKKNSQAHCQHFALIMPSGSVKRKASLESDDPPPAKKPLSTKCAINFPK
jgi:hypothetical protein